MSRNNLASLIRKYLDKELYKGIAYKDAIIKELATKAKDGDITAARLLFEYSEGKPAQIINAKVEHEHTHKLPDVLEKLVEEIVGKSIELINEARERKEKEKKKIKKVESQSKPEILSWGNPE